MAAVDKAAEMLPPPLALVIMAQNKIAKWFSEVDLLIANRKAQMPIPFGPVSALIEGELLDAYFDNSLSFRETLAQID